MKKIIMVLFALVFAMSIYSLTIVEDKFDDNTSLTGWKRSSTTNTASYTGTPKVGDACLQLKYNANVITYVKLTGFKNIVLTYKMAKNSLETNEKVVCEYSTNGGSTWTAAATLLNTAANNTFTSYTANIANCTVLQLRFKIVGSATDDYAYIDDVKITGDLQ